VFSAIRDPVGHVGSSVSTRSPSGALLYYSSQWSYPAEEWRKAVCSHFGPDEPLDFRCYDPADPASMGDISEIHFALVYGAPQGLLASLPSLRVTLSISSGVDHVLSDPSYPRNRVPVLRMVDHNQIAMMGEYVVHAILDHHRAMPFYREQQRACLYRRINTPYTPSVDVLVLGLGYMGAEIARKLSLFGFKVRGWSRSRKNIPGVMCYAGAHECLLTSAVPSCSYVINALPLTNETKGILNRDLFDQLKNGACLVNVGRGGHVVEDDLLAALGSGRLSHAYLDVFDTEPLPQPHPFWGHPQISITPHVAGELLPRSCAVGVSMNIRAYSL